VLRRDKTRETVVERDVVLTHSRRLDLTKRVDVSERLSCWGLEKVSGF